MKIILKYIGKVREAKININGITVIAGLNSSGKTTIAKAIDGIIYPLTNLEERILNKKIQSMARLAETWLREALLKADDSNLRMRENRIVPIVYYFRKTISKKLKQLYLDDTEFKITEELLKTFISEIVERHYRKMSIELISSDRTKEAIKLINEAYLRNNDDYAKLIFLQHLSTLFSNQIETFNCTEKSEICLENYCNIEFEESDIKKFEVSSSNNNKVSSIVYLPAYRFTHKEEDSFKERLLEQLNKSSIFKDPDLLLEEYESIKQNLLRFQKLIDSVIHGHLERNENGFSYIEDTHPTDQIALDNVASGILPFAYIRRLIENGTLKEGSVLVIDEPEMNLHPEWQLDFAKLLVSLNREIGVKSVLVSHSPYFIRAVQKILATEGEGVEGSFYQMQAENNLFVSVDVTNDSKKIYQQLYRPFEEL